MLEQFGRRIAGLFKVRWLASILLILLLDLSTYLAFKESSGARLIQHQDKVLHALAFFGLSVVGHISLSFDFFPRKRGFSWRILGFNWFIWIGYGAFIELTQKYLRYRSASWADLVADVVGILLGALFIYSIKLYPRSPAVYEKKRL